MRKPLLAALGALVVGACSDGAPGNGVSLSVAALTSAPPAAPGAFPAPAADAVITDGTNTIELTSVQVVLREIELERVETADCNATVGDDDCEEFETGPVLVDVPLTGGVETVVTVDVPPGTYDEIEFEVHKISSDDEEDAEFRAAHPDFTGISIRVVGSYNGTPFTYETDLDVEQEFDLATPLKIEEGTGGTNLTVRIDLSAWFRALDGSLVNPATGNKGGQNEGLVKENIKQSFEAFEDRDEDGDDSDES
jgi:hypothetical protein